LKLFGEQLSAAVMEGSGKSFLIDLSGVTFMDSAGLRALVGALELRSGKDLIDQSSPQVFTLLHLANLIDGAMSNVEVLAPRRSSARVTTSRHKPVLISC
jgi:anti-anti-sigma factor